MIDTIKFKIPYNDDLMSKIRKNGFVNQKVDSIGFADEYKVFDAIRIPPYDKAVQLYSKDVPFGGHSLYLEFSVPKLVYGTNVYLLPVNKIREVFESVFEILQNKYGYFPTLDSWIVQRLDICYFWKFSSLEIAQRHIEFISFLRYPRKNRFFYKTTAMFSGRSFTARFYIKQPEYLKTDYKFLPEDEAEKGLQYCTNMVRFEVEMRKTELDRIFKRDVEYQDLLNEDFYYKQLKFYLSIFNFQPELFPQPKKYDNFTKTFQIKPILSEGR